MTGTSSHLLLKPSYFFPNCVGEAMLDLIDLIDSDLESRRHFLGRPLLIYVEIEYLEFLGLSAFDAGEGGVE